jgi:hypothetical protein
LFQTPVGFETILLYYVEYYGPQGPVNGKSSGKQDKDAAFKKEAPFFLFSILLLL